MWKLPRDFSSVSRRQGTPQGDRQETERVLREKETAAGGTEWVSLVSIDHRHYVCGSPTAGTRVVGRGTSKRSMTLLIEICSGKCYLVSVCLHR